MSEARLLSRVWALGNVPDVEALCRAVLAEQLRRSPMPVSQADRDDTVAHLLGEAHIAWLKYDPAFEAKGAGTGTFSGFLYARLRRRLIDHWRKQWGRDGARLPTGITPDDLPEAAIEDAPFVDADWDSFVSRPEWQGELVEAYREHRELLEREQRRAA